MQMSKLAVLLLCCLLVSGCVPLLIGGVGVLGGYAISRDTIAAETSKNIEDIWQASKDIVSIMGIIKTANEETKVIEATIYSSAVTIRLERLTEVTSRLKVKARKYMMPNIGLAQKVFVKIMQKLE